MVLPLGGTETISRPTGAPSEAITARNAARPASGRTFAVTHRVRYSQDEVLLTHLKDLFARPWRTLLWLVIASLCAWRFSGLAADFPNHSQWVLDQAKFTDEGWWGGAAVMYHLTGHWFVAGDYNPATAVPVWPRSIAGFRDLPQSWRMSARSTLYSPVSVSTATSLTAAP